MIYTEWKGWSSYNIQTTWLLLGTPPNFLHLLISLEIFHVYLLLLLYCYSKIQEGCICLKDFLWKELQRTSWVYSMFQWIRKLVDFNAMLNWAAIVCTLINCDLVILWRTVSKDSTKNIGGNRIERFGNSVFMGCKYMSGMFSSWEPNGVSKFFLLQCIK